MIPNTNGIRDKRDKNDPPDAALNHFGEEWGRRRRLRHHGEFAKAA
jgi:hypothetical protein